MITKAVNVTINTVREILEKPRKWIVIWKLDGKTTMTPFTFTPPIKERAARKWAQSRSFGLGFEMKPIVE